MRAATPPTTHKRIIQLVSSAWHRESRDDKALMLTATVFALCEDGVLLRRDFDFNTKHWIWRVEDTEVS